jgi:hypothetical protein
VSTQQWIVKLVQDLQPGDLIAGMRYLLEVKEVSTDSETILVKVHADLYKQLTTTYSIKHDKPMPVCSCGKHMDAIIEPKIFS